MSGPRIHGYNSDSKQPRAIYVDGFLANPTNRDLNCNVEFCVDTGASITLIPERIAKKLKLKNTGVVRVQLADGRIVNHNVGYVYLYIAGEGLMLFAAITPDGDALLGCDVMELLQFQLDVARKKVLKPIRRFKTVSILLRVTGKRLCEILSKKH